MVKWEYKTVYMCHGIDIFAGRELNVYGREGWEMCGFDSNNNNAVFKRQIVDNEK